MGTLILKESNAPAGILFEEVQVQTSVTQPRGVMMPTWELMISLNRGTRI